MSASSIAWSCSERASASSALPRVWDQAYARPSRERGYGVDVVQLLGGVEARPVDVHRRDRQRRQHQRARALDPLLDTGSEGAAEERRSADPQPGQHLASVAQVHPGTRQPLSRVAPASTRRSKSASDSTRTTRPRLRLTSAT